MQAEYHLTDAITTDAKPPSEVEWKRQFAGIPYYDQVIGIHVNAETGAVQAFGTRFTSAPPAGTLSPLHLTAPQALRVASEYLGKFPLSDLTYLDVYPSVVLERRPTQKPSARLPFWIDDKPVAHIAWVVRSYYFDNAKCYVEVWVDMQSGQVVGGENQRTRGGRVQAPERLSTLLQQAEQVRLFTRGPRGTWRDVPAATLNAQERSAKFALLKTASEVAAPSKPSIARVKAEVRDPNGKTITMFVSTTGELIGAGQRAKLPHELWRWIVGLSASKLKK